jgi:hypothetical protein
MRKQLDGRTGRGKKDVLRERLIRDFAVLNVRGKMTRAEGFC